MKKVPEPSLKINTNTREIGNSRRPTFSRYSRKLANAFWYALWIIVSVDIAAAQAQTSIESDICPMVDWAVPANNAANTNSSVAGTAEGGEPVTITRIDGSGDPIDFRTGGANASSALVVNTDQSTNWTEGGLVPSQTSPPDYIRFDTRDASNNNTAPTYRLQFTFAQAVTNPVISFSGTANRKIVTSVPSSLVSSELILNGSQGGNDGTGGTLPLPTATAITNGVELTGAHGSDRFNTSIQINGTVTTFTVDLDATADTRNWTNQFGASIWSQIDNTGVSMATANCGPAAVDYGDAPDTYGTDATANNSSNNSDPIGPSHTIVSGIHLGTAPDSETNGQPSANADGDGAEDDGITFPTLTAGDTSYTIPVGNITATGTGTLHAWLDFNKNGTFETGEHTSIGVTNGAPAGALAWTGITAGAAGDTYARFRFTADASIDANTPGGAASDGEVEDYQVAIAPPPPPSPGDPQCLAPENMVIDGSFDNGLANYTITGNWGIRNPPSAVFNPNNEPSGTLANGYPAPGSTFGFNSNDSANDTTILVTPSLPVDQTYLDGQLDIWFDTAWQHASGNGSKASTLEVQVNGIPYWQMTTVDGDEGGVFANITTLNGATTSANSPSTLQVKLANGGGGITDSQWGVIHLIVPYTSNATPQIEFAMKGQGPNSDDFAVDRIYSPVCLPDRGDAPDTYSTDITANNSSNGNDSPGPFHRIINDLHLGTSPDGEIEAQSPLDGTGDGADEDGVTIPSLTAGQTATITADVSGTGGYLQGWIDWDGNGTFDSGEQVATNLQDDGTGDDVSANDGTITFDLNVPAGAITTADTFARFRWSTTPGLNTTDAANDGEVEDYQVAIASAPILACGIPNPPETGLPSQYNNEIYWFDWTGLAELRNVGQTDSFNFTLPDGRTITATVKYLEGTVGTQALNIPSVRPLSPLFPPADFPTSLRPTIRSNTGGHWDNDVKIEVTFSEDLNLVVADGEASQNSPGNTGSSLDQHEEHIDFTTDGGAWQVIDSSRSANYNLTGSADGKTFTTQSLNEENGTPLAVSSPATTLTVNLDTSANGATGAAFGMFLPDVGDAPNSYGVASHRINYFDCGVDTDPHLGTVRPDGEEPGDVQSVGADGDNTGAGAGRFVDEDGVANFDGLGTNTTSYSRQVTVNNPNANPADIVAWIDLDGSDTFDEDERATVSVEAGDTATLVGGQIAANSSGTLTLNWSSLPGITAGDTYARIRIATNGQLVAGSDGGEDEASIGFVRSGEVEDYPVAIADGANYACPTAIADIWFANDESSSIDDSQFDNALDFLYQISDGFIYDDVTGIKAGITGWASSENSTNVVIPITESFGDPEDSGLISTTITTDGDGQGVRELYDSKKSPTSGTRLNLATNYLADLIEAGNGRRTGIPQIAVILTDASIRQLSTDRLGGGSAWVDEANTLRNAGPDGTNIILIITEQAATAYNDDEPDVRSTVDAVVGQNGQLLIVPTYAEAADVTEGYVDIVSQAICNSTTPIASDPNLLLAKRITAINPGQSDEVRFNTFVDDNNNPNDNDPNWPDDDNTYLPGRINVTDVKPGDEVEYTIYFLSNGDINANKVQICDVIPDEMSFVKNTYDVEVGIGLELSTANPPSTSPPSTQLSNVLGDETGSDKGAFYAPGTTPPAFCDKVTPGDTNNPPTLIDVDSNNNVSGAVLVEINDPLPPATSPGDPVGSYGFIRFRAKVK